jgi:RHS repeat-associated protein
MNTKEELSENTRQGFEVKKADALLGSMEAKSNNASGMPGTFTAERHRISLSYYRARWYDPAAKRFISEDPIGLDGGINLYAYVGNNPVNLIDPQGLDEFPADFIGPLMEKDWRAASLPVLAKCISSQFPGYKLIDIKSTIGHGSSDKRNKDGSATLLDPSGKEIIIVNDIHEYSTRDPEMANPSSTPYEKRDKTNTTRGFTNSGNPFTNYTAREVTWQYAIDVQIWELGNSLSIISGSAPETLKNYSYDPGATTLGCYMDATGRGAEKRWLRDRQ